MNILSAKSVGITGFAVPTRTCSEEKCPFHGSLRVRGYVLSSTLVQMRSRSTVVVENQYTFFNKKYQRHERRRSRIHAHLPQCVDVAEGDVVVVGETRHIAKSVSFVVLGRRVGESG